MAKKNNDNATATKNGKGKKILGIILALLIIIGGMSMCSDDSTSNTNVDDNVTKIEMTVGQEQALAMAELHLDTMPFSHDGLIHQLEFEGFSTEEATFAADNCGADWNEQAAKMAELHLDTMPMSHDQLINQLEFEKFTTEQAEYGVAAVGY